MNTIQEAIQANPEINVALDFERNEFIMSIAEEAAEKIFFQVVTQEEERVYQALKNTRRWHDEAQAEIFRLAERIKGEAQEDPAYAKFLRGNLGHAIKKRDWYRAGQEVLEVKMYQIRKVVKGQ